MIMFLRIDGDGTIGIKNMATFLSIAKGIDAGILVDEENLKIESGTITLFITPECRHMKEMQKRVFKIIK